MNIMYDIELKRSCWSDVSSFPIAFDATLANHDFMCSCDGGLVCLVSQEKFLVDPIIVGNLLTDEWKALPHMPHLSSGNKKPLLVQLVMDEDTKCYKVVLVCRDKYEGALAANCYNSGTGGWSKLDSGLVYGYGGSHDWLSAREEDPCIFDCTTNMLFKLSQCSSTRGNGSVKKLSMVKDRVFVLHRWGHDEYKVLEYTWDSTASDLRNLSTIDSTLQVIIARQF